MNCIQNRSHFPTIQGFHEFQRIGVGRFAILPRGFMDFQGRGVECPGDFARCSGHTCTRLICNVRFDGGFFVFVTVVFAIVVLVVVVVVIAGGGCRNAHKPRASRHRSLRPNALAAAARLPVDCQLDKILCLCSSSFCAAMRCSFRELLCYRKFQTNKLYKTCSKCSMKDQCPLAGSHFHH